MALFLRTLHLAMKSILQKQFGANFKRIKKSKKLSQETVAKHSGTNASYISEIESGNANPTLLTTAKLAMGFEAEVAELFSFGQLSVSREEIGTKIKAIIDEAGDDAIQGLYAAVYRTGYPHCQGRAILVTRMARFTPFNPRTGNMGRGI